MRASTSRARLVQALRTATRSGFSGLVAVVIGVSGLAPAAAGEWLPLAKDGIHDPKGPGVKTLQQPRDALSKLTPDYTGNQVRWVQALDKGEIQPREKLLAKTEVKKLDRDIILDIKGSMPAVRFPHRQHTEWLDCSNCHEGIFKTKAGETKISMFLILQGEQCGICHGAVAFPLTECMRCHSIPRQPGEKVEIPAGFGPGVHLPGAKGP